MEIQSSSSENRYTPLVGEDIDGLDNPDRIIDNIKCVKYMDGKNYRVKMICPDQEIPDMAIYQKKKKKWVSGDYMIVLMMQAIKDLKSQNSSLQRQINELRGALH